MKYIQGVMADYFKPLINADKKKMNNISEKSEVNDGVKPNAQAFGMGDFDYQNCSVVSFDKQIEEEELDQIARNTKNLFTKIENELAANFEEQRCLEQRLNSFEENLERKKQLFEACRNLYNKETTHIKFISEKNEQFAENIHHHEEIMDSWQIFIDEFRKIPDNSVQ